MASHQLNSINNYTLFRCNLSHLLNYVYFCLYMYARVHEGSCAYLVFTMLLLFTFIPLITRGQYIYAGVYNIFLIPYYKRDLYIIH